MRHANTKEQNKYMKIRRRQNMARHIPAEEWAFKQLKETGIFFKRQVIWGCRIFDFFSIKHGIAVEIDGAEHNRKYDEERDRYNYIRSGIIVFRVRNFNQNDMDTVIRSIFKITESKETRKERRKMVRTDLGLKQHDPMKLAVEAAGLKLAHCNWTPNYEVLNKLKFKAIEVASKSNLIKISDQEKTRKEHKIKLKINTCGIKTVEKWCIDNGWHLKIHNNGVHWNLSKQEKIIDWWPSTSKYVRNKKFNQGAICYDYEQLIQFLEKEFDERKISA